MAESMGRHMLFVLQFHGGDAGVEALNYHGCVQLPLCWYTNNSKTLLSVAPENRNSNERDRVVPHILPLQTHLFLESLVCKNHKKQLVLSLFPSGWVAWPWGFHIPTTDPWHHTTSSSKPRGHWDTTLNSSPFLYIPK